MIAISYRRKDSMTVAGRLYDRLQSEFGRGRVFMDFDSIPYGVDFRDHITNTLEKARVVVVVIGREWLGKRVGTGRRIDDPDDFVRLEVAEALRREIPLIPVLIDKTPMPKAEALPNDIATLAYRNAVALDSGIDFHHHAERLIAGIRKAMNEGAPAIKGPLKNRQRTPVGARRNPVFLASAIGLAAILVALTVWAIVVHRGERKPAPPETIARVAEHPDIALPAAASPSEIKSTGMRAEPTVSAVLPPPPPSVRRGPQKLFAGTWRGTIHNVGPQSAWDSEVELTIDETETRWGNMEKGSVFRRGRTLAYTWAYKTENGEKEQLHATLIVHEDGKTATYTMSERRGAGKTRSETFGKGTVEKVR